MINLIDGRLCEAVFKDTKQENDKVSVKLKS